MTTSKVHGTAQPQMWSSLRAQTDFELHGRARLAVSTFAVSSVEEPCILPGSTCQQVMTQPPTSIDSLHTVNHHGALINCTHTKPDEQNP